MLAAVVTVQVQLLVPEFSVATSYLIFSLSHYVDSGTFSGRNQCFGCALAWVTIARDSDSEYPFFAVGQFRRSLIFSLPIGGEI